MASNTGRYIAVSKYRPTCNTFRDIIVDRELQSYYEIKNVRNELDDVWYISAITFVGHLCPDLFQRAVNDSGNRNIIVTVNYNTCVFILGRIGLTNVRSH